MQSFNLALFLALGMTLCYAKVDAGTDANSVNPSEKSVNSTAPAEKQQYTTSLQSSLFPTELSWKTGLGQALIFVGATAFSFVLVGGLTLLIAPLFGYKTCTILGNCDQVATTYSAQPNMIESYPQQQYYGPSGPYATFQKRSVEYIKPAEYIKPILETLAKAYEKSS